MSEIKFTESSLESAIIERLQELGYNYAVETDNWMLNRKLDSFINEELLLERLMVISNSPQGALAGYLIFWAIRFTRI